MIITISGSPGSGKSSVAKLLVKKLGYERVYAGGIMRETARERGLTLEQFMDYLSHDEKLEKEIDYKVRERAYELERMGKDVLVEGRVQYHLIPDSLKIYIKVDQEEGARRILKDLGDAQASKDRNQRVVSTVEEMVQLNSIREETDALRYKNLYGIDHRNETQYDLVIDTTGLTIEQGVEKVIKFVWKNRGKAL
jgi:predicted cytidylate kinase